MDSQNILRTDYICTFSISFCGASFLSQSTAKSCPSGFANPYFVSHLKLYYKFHVAGPIPSYGSLKCQAEFHVE